MQYFLFIQKMNNNFTSDLTIASCCVGRHKANVAMTTPPPPSHWPQAAAPLPLTFVD